MPPPRSLSRLDLTAIGVNSVIGSSVFLFPGALAGLLGPASILAFGLTGLLLLAVGLCFAEASTHFDRAGGAYLYSRAAFGPKTGFAVGWLNWISYVFGWAAVANGIGAYLGSIALSKAIAAAVILSLGALNYRGVKIGARVSNGFTLAKLAALLLFLLACLPKVRLENLVPFSPHGWAPLGQACFLAYFAFQGFEAIPVPSGEAQLPRRHVPFAVTVSLLLATAVYMLVQLAAVGVDPNLSNAERPLAQAAAVVWGPAGALFIAIAAAVSMTGYNSCAALVAPRLLSALAEDGHLPRALAEPHPRFATPHLSIVLTTALVLSAAMAFDFRHLVDFSNVAVCAQYLATCAAVPILRRRFSPEPGAFRLPFGYAVPVLGFLATLWLGLQGGRSELFVSFAVLLVGFLLRSLHARGLWDLRPAAAES